MRPLSGRQRALLDRLMPRFWSTSSIAVANDSSSISPRLSHPVLNRSLAGPTELVTRGLTVLVARSTFKMKAKSRTDPSPARTIDRRISWRTDLQEIT